MSDRKFAEYNLDVHNIRVSAQPGYGGISLLYVLKGNIGVQSAELCITLQPNDIFLINQNDRYQISSHDENIILRLEIANHYFARYYDDYFHSRFQLIPEQQSGFYRQYINNIKILMARIFTAHIRADNQFASLEIHRLLSEILLTLVLHFRDKTVDARKASGSYSKRIEQVIRFLETNYAQSISLKQVADQEHVSFAHLSRLFKKEVGLSFTQYLTKQRFEHSVQDLLATNQPIYQIAQHHGFPNTRQFITLFKQIYNRTPHQFRDAYRQDKTLTPTQGISVRQPEAIQQQIMLDVDPIEVLALLGDVINSNPGKGHFLDQYYAAEELTVDLSSHKKPQKLHNLSYIVAVGELNEVLKNNIQTQILTTKQEIGLDYIEVHHLISGSAILPDYRTDEVVPSFSPYTNSDAAIAFLKRHHIALFVRIYHRNAAADPVHYASKLADFIRHSIHVFGTTYIQQWRFIYFAEDKAMTDSLAFAHSYQTLRHTIKSLLPQSAVGLFYHFSTEEQLRHEPLFSNQLVRDIDFLGYAANPNEQINFSQVGGNAFASSEHYVQNKTRRIKNALKYHDLQLPLYLLTWNTLTGDTRHTNGMFFRGALILKTVLDMSSQISGLGIWINAEIQQETLPERIDISSLALFYIFDTRRPAFYALKFRERLQGKIVAQGDNYLVTDTDYGYQVILTNTVSFNPYISVREHMIENFRKIKKLTVLGLQSGAYQIRRFIFDQQHGALYRQFELFQSQFGKDDEIVDYLHRQTVPQLTISDEQIQTRWEVMCDMDINAIHFYELRRMP